MDNFTSPLANVKIAAPCASDWNNMTGNEQVRFCNQCNLNVYNLSTMTKDAAEDLLRRNEGKLCVRYYRRADGTILTENCPVGLRALKLRLAKVATATFAAAISFFTSIGFFNLMPKDEPILPLQPTSQQLYQINTPSPELLRQNSSAEPVDLSKVNIGEPQPVEQPGWVTGGLVAPPPPSENTDIVEPPPASIVHRSEGVIRGNALERPTPTYPQLARVAHVSGDVQIDMTIDEEGNVIVARVKNGHPLLQQAALQAARQWKFKTTSLNNHPVKVQGVLTFRFTL